MRKYIVETEDGDMKVLTTTPFKELFHRCPRVKNGTIDMEGVKYMVDPHKFRRLGYKPWRFLKLVTEYCYVQFYAEGKSTPVDLFGNEMYGMPDDDRTGRKFAELARSERLKRLVHQGTDWRDMALILLAIGMVVMGVAFYANSHAG